MLASGVYTSTKCNVFRKLLTLSDSIQTIPTCLCSVLSLLGIDQQLEEGSPRKRLRTGKLVGRAVRGPEQDTTHRKRRACI